MGSKTLSLIGVTSFQVVQDWQITTRQKMAEDLRRIRDFPS